MENIYYFPSCRSGPISLIHSFTPSLPVRHLETGDGGKGSSNKKRQGETYVGSISNYCSREDPVGTCRPNSRNREIAEIKPENKNEIRAFLMMLWQLKMSMFRRQHPKWYQNLWFVLDTTSILSTFAYTSTPPPSPTPHPPLVFDHLPFKAVSQSVAPCQVSYSVNSDLSTQYLLS